MDLLPPHSIDGAASLQIRFRKNGRTAHRPVILEAGHAVAYHRLQRRADQPRRMTDAVPYYSRTEPQRHVEAVMLVHFAISGDRHIDGYHQGLESCSRDPFQQSSDLIGMARKIGLKP